MPSDGALRRQDRPGKTSRRGLLRGAAALAVSGPALAAARENRAKSASGSRLAYVGTYSSPQGPEGSRGRGEGIYLFEMDPSTGALSQRELFGMVRTRPAWL